MAEIGKISGPLLEDNLQRSGVDLAIDTDLLYFDVTNRRLGLSNIAPVATVAAATARSINLEVDTQLTVNNINLYTNTIQYPIGNLVLQANQVVYAPNWKTSSNLNLGSNTIGISDGDLDLNISPRGTGIVNIPSDVLVTGSLHATGDITFDGNLTFGSDNTDTVSFRADLTSDIRPDVTNLYSLGTSSNRWNNVYSKNVYTDAVQTASTYTVNNIELTLRQGKSWYVSINGNDSNVGNHQNGPYRTVAKALHEATAGDTIFIYPGVYSEVFPLTVPTGVTVTGLDIRTTVITPTTLTHLYDAFLLNGDCTVSNLTVKDFYFDHVNVTGFAFRFAPGAKILAKSPYIQNVTIITAPSGNLEAGNGALVDGSAVATDSYEAGMLFSSVTMIVPGAEGVIAKNGARVEWLNCFTYYANIGLYAINGTQGFANQGTKFGAEFRSVNSANVYGTFGAKADGNKTLMYLTGHNFAYVGTGSSGTNDPTLVVEGNQTVMANGGTIYCQATDQSGNVYIGTVFKINGETGAIHFNTSGLNLGGSSSISFTSGNHLTYLDPTVVQQDNLTFTGSSNNIQSTLGNIIFSPQSGVINLNTNTFTIPKGNDASLTLNTPGEIRFNIDNNHFEGYAANGLLNLYAIEDSTRTTRITPELTPGAADKTIRMYANNDLKVIMNTTSVVVKDLYVGNLKFTQPNLTIDANQTMTLLPTGTGIVRVKNFTIEDDLITNTTSSANISIDSANGSYVRVPGNNGIVIPTGDNSTRPNLPEVGMQRYNTELEYLEVWNGSAWVNASGTTAVSSQDMTDIADFWALILG